MSVFSRRSIRHAEGTGARKAWVVGTNGHHRGQTRIRRTVHRARFPFFATFEDFDFTFQTSVKRSLLGSFLGPELISEARNLILCGPAGVGKTHLAIAVAYRAIQNGSTALFREANDLIEELSEASREGRLRAALEPYTHTGVLVIDEIGYLSYPQDAANVLFQVVNRRNLEKRPMVFTTNKPLAAWAEVLHDADLAEAIIDRVLERGRFIELRGTSYRTRHLSQDSAAARRRRLVRLSGIQGSEFPEPTVARGTSKEGLVSTAPEIGTSGEPEGYEPRSSDVPWMK